MIIKAKITLVFNSEAIATAVASSLAPENLTAPPSMKIVMVRRGKELVITISERDISKLAVAVNDVLMSAYLARAALEASS
jgi:tRNA threonylcarbamoyladenosine modification (KEOPS) complex  Pcc1 subunit